MGKNYHIKLNPDPLSRERIESHMDFDELLRQYQEADKQQVKRPRVIKLAYVALAAAAALALLMVLNIWNGASSPQSESAYFAKLPFVNPPLSEWEPEFISYKMNVNQGGVYEYESGSRLVVPAAAFMNDRGRLVEGDVAIHYRELHDFVDFFLSGIPMNYDSAGRQFYLESIGMVEIYAEQNGERLQMAPGKEIQVELVTHIRTTLDAPLPHYSVYTLDTLNRNWAYREEARLEVLEEKLDAGQTSYSDIQKEWLESRQALEKSYDAQLAALEAMAPKPTAPVKPQRQLSGQPTIELNFQDDNFDFEGDNAEEIALTRKLKDAIWQISPQSPPYDENAFKVTWERMRLKPINEWDYTLTLINGNRRLQLIVNPVLVGEAYEQAMAQYEAGLAEYESQMDYRESQLKARREALLQQEADETRFLDEAFTERLAEAGAPQGKPALLAKVISRFKAHQLGVWNCDRPLPVGEDKLNLKFVDENGETFTPRTAYFAGKTHNTVHRFLATEKTALALPSDDAHLIWLVTDDNRIALVRQSNTEHKGRKTQTVVMKVAAEPLRSEEDIRAVLKF